MSPFAIAAIAAIALAASSLFFLAVEGGTGTRRAVRANLTRGLETRHTGPTPQRRRQASWGRRLARPSQVATLERLIVRAGRPDTWPVDRVLNVKLLGALTAAAVGLLLVNVNRTPQVLLFAISIVVLAYFVPDLLLLNTGIKRREAIALELPDTLDQMSIAVEAGLGFDAAMVRVARNGKGILAGEMIRTLQDIQVGQPRRDAFEGLAFRANVPELRRFVRAVIQAEEYGIALADVLMTQAREMRVARRQRAEASAMKIPVKVTLPLILCLLPVLLIVVIGPGVLNIIEGFSG